MYKIDLQRRSAVTFYFEPDQILQVDHGRINGDFFNPASLLFDQFYKSQFNPLLTFRHSYKGPYGPLDQNRLV